MTIEGIASVEMERLIRLGAVLLGGYGLVFWLGLVFWTYRDVISRSRGIFLPTLSILLVLLFNLPGLLLYLVLRPRETLSEVYAKALDEEALIQELEDQQACPGCKRNIEPDFILCPNCHTQLRRPCPHCSRLMHQKWTLCPYCGQPCAENSAIKV